MGNNHYSAASMNALVLEENNLCSGSSTSWICDGLYQVAVFFPSLWLHLSLSPLSISALLFRSLRKSSGNCSSIITGLFYHEEERYLMHRPQLGSFSNKWYMGIWFSGECGQKRGQPEKNVKKKTWSVEIITFLHCK